MRVHCSQESTCIFSAFLHIRSTKTKVESKAFQKTCLVFQAWWGKGRTGKKDGKSPQSTETDSSPMSHPLFGTKPPTLYNSKPFPTMKARKPIKVLFQIVLKNQMDWSFSFAFLSFCCGLLVGYFILFHCKLLRLGILSKKIR